MSAERASRAAWAVALAVMVGALGGAGAWLLLRQRREGDRQLGELMCCLTGSEPVAASGADRAARRLDRRAPAAELEHCASLAETAALRDDDTTADVQAVADALHGGMGAPPPRVDDLPDLEPLYRLLEARGVVPADAACGRPRVVVADDRIAEAERRMTGRHTWWTEGDGLPEARIVLEGSTPRLAVAASGERPVARLEWTEDPASSSHWDPGPAEAELGPVARFSWRRCPGGDRGVVLDERETRAHVVTLRPEVIRGPVLTLPPLEPAGLRSSLELRCSPEAIEIGWAQSHPDLASKRPPLGGAGSGIPAGSHQHHIYLARCARDGCTTRQVTVEGLQLVWQSNGGYGSSMSLTAPHVHPLGEAVAIWWVSAPALVARVAPLEALPTTEDRWLAELLPPGASRPANAFQLEKMHQSEPRSLVRGDALLLTYVEETEIPTSYLFRLDAGGGAELLLPPPPP
ncbi:MAG: hypothetical protein R3B72_48625 [Polyangiaceae bacterium]